MAVTTTLRDRFFLRRRSRTAAVATTVIISLVMTLMGGFAGGVILLQGYLERLESSLEMQIFLHDGLRQEAREALASQLREAPYTDGLRFISREEAARILLDKTGEDVTVLLGGLNPLPDAYAIQLKPAYRHPDSAALIQARLSEDLAVAEVRFPAAQLERVRKNTGLLTLIAGVLGLVLGLIAFLLIGSAVRLALYAQRLSIRSMQLIGATEGFIMRPFLLAGLVQGGVGSVIATGLLAGLYAVLRTVFADELTPAPGQLTMLIGLLGGIVLFGLVIGLTASYAAVRRFLHRSLDELM
ncbi:MAG: ABC transporter permease [Bacteroidia bacterium]|nr:ABC transporter permease [Bacteroidia bacterium]